MAIYIKGMGNISPQQSWNDETALLQAFDYRGSHLKCVEPNYEQWIDVRLLRRMSRTIKMGVTASLMALKEAKLNKPDAVITGTGYGCLQDTESFLTRMIDNNEEALNPTPFIQSTHNTVGSQIALLFQCLGYNQTYAHSAFSFESALIDAELQLLEEPWKNILIGGIDEITEVSHLIQNRFGIFRRKLASTLNLFKHPKRGTVNGEGAAFFVVSSERDQHSLASIQAVKTLYKPDTQQLRDSLEVFLRQEGLTPGDIDLILLGKSGDKVSDASLDALMKAVFPKSSIGLYKHLCGEYPVSTSFALWLGSRILVERHVPEVVQYKHVSRPLKHVLIFNTYFETHYSFILLKTCHDTL